MARLVSYKTRDGNRYSTFGGGTNYKSSENLTKSNRIRLLPKTKIKAKNKSKMPTVPTIAASIEMHQNKIAQSRPTNVSSGGSNNGGNISQGIRRRPINQRSQSKSNCCFNSNFFTRKCNWPCNQSDSCCCIKCWRTMFYCCCWWKWCCRRKFWARICCGRCIDYDDCKNDDDDDEDIDAKFEQYKYEMRLTELKRERCDTVNEEQETSLQSNSYRTEFLPLTPSLPTLVHSSNTINDHKTSMAHDGNAIRDATTNGKISSSSSPSLTTKNPSRIFRYRKYWNWNDSLRSNSDKFLETLEYDTDGEQSLKRANNKHKRTDVSAQTKGYTGFARLLSASFICARSLAFACHTGSVTKLF